MRILLISAAFPPNPGGVATHVNDLSHGLVHLGHHVFVVTLNRDETPRTDGHGRLVIWKRGRKEVDEFDGRRVFCEEILDFILQKWYNIKPDIIHVHDFGSLFIGWLLKRAFQRPLIMTVHRAPSPWRNGRFREYPKDCFMEAMRVSGLIDGIVVPSEASANILRAQGFKSIADFDLIKVIPHGIRLYARGIANDPTVIRKLRLRRDSILVICPSRADEHKDADTFVEATGLLKERNPDLNLVFLLCSQKDDVYHERVRNRAATLGLLEGKEIFFKPFLYKQMPTLYRRAKVCVVPSRHEAFGLTVLEAFLFGVPVVAANTSALREIITNGTNGLLFTDGNAADLANQVQRVIKDHELREILKNNGKEAIQKTRRYDGMTMVREHELFYTGILDRLTGESVKKK